MAHKLQWFSTLIFSFLGLIIQVWIPKILQNGITNVLILKTQPLHNYVELIGVLALFTGIFGYISRTNLFKVATRSNSTCATSSTSTSRGCPSPSTTGSSLGS